MSRVRLFQGHSQLEPSDDVQVVSAALSRVTFILVGQDEREPQIDVAGNVKPRGITPTT